METGIDAGEIAGAFALLEAGGELGGEVDAVEIGVGEIARDFGEQAAVGAALVGDAAGADGVADIEVFEAQNFVHAARVGGVVALLGEAAVLVGERVLVDARDAARHLGKIGKEAAGGFGEFGAHQRGVGPGVSGSGGLADGAHQVERDGGRRCVGVGDGGVFGGGEGKAEVGVEAHDLGGGAEDEGAFRRERFGRFALAGDFLEGEGGEVGGVPVVGNPDDAVGEDRCSRRGEQAAGEAIHADGADVKRDGVVAGVFLVRRGDGEDHAVDGRGGHGASRQQVGEFGGGAPEERGDVGGLEAGVDQMATGEEQRAHGGRGGERVVDFWMRVSA